MSNLNDWLSTDQRRREFAEEALIVDVAEQVWGAMEANGVTKSQLAEQLGKSKPFVTQMLSGSRNMTLRSLAGIAHTLGYEVHMSLRSHAAADGWRLLPEAVVAQCDPRRFNPAPIDSVDGNWTQIKARAA